MLLSSGIIQLWNFGFIFYFLFLTFRIRNIVAEIRIFVL